MSDFIASADLTDDEINQLGTDMTMSILFTALASLPETLISNALEESRQKEVVKRTKNTVAEATPKSVVERLMFESMSQNATQQILSEITKAKEMG